MNVRDGLFLCAFVLAGAGEASAHASPPVVLLPEREAVAALAGGGRATLRNVTLTPAERAAIHERWGWKADRGRQRVYLAADPASTGVAAVVFVTEATHHGPMRIAVAVDAEGRVKDARVVEVTDESLRWAKALVDDGLPREFVGRGCHDAFTIPARFERMESMRRFYAECVARLVQHATILYEVAVRQRASGAPSG